MLVPFDLEEVARSLDRTNRLIVVHEAPAGGSWGATLIAALLQDGFENARRAPRLIAADETPIRASDCLIDESPDQTANWYGLGAGDSNG
jgi:pyruvate/2-oxoglutarate/acetoin dehydrogenase E1 component